MASEEWKILVPNKIDEAGISLLNEIGVVEQYDMASSKLDYGSLNNADAIIHRAIDITSDFLNEANSLKIISKHGTGLDQIDVDHATMNDVLVCNTPGENAQSVAEHTISLILALKKDIRNADAHVRKGQWDRHNFVNTELDEKMLGLLGFGDIAKRVGKLATCMGMNCISYDPYIDESNFPDYVKKVNAVEDLMEYADVVSVHVPLTDETRNMISEQELKSLGNSGMIVNTSRGEIIDEDAICSALANGNLSGFATDVFADEPPSNKNPLYDLESTILTPHIGASTQEALERVSIAAAKNVIRMYNGEMPKNVVNKDVASKGFDPN